MFLMRLMYLNSFKPNEKVLKNDDLSKLINKQDLSSNLKTDSIEQIKNVIQEKKVKPEIQIESKVEGKISINSFAQLCEVCSEKKEIKLKYELEKNVNLVSFEKSRLEISFNDNLDKDFVKDLSLKLFEWTGQRWIISFSKTKGEISIKEKEKNKKIELINQAKKTDLYKNVLEKFTDANLVDVFLKKNDENE